MTAPQIHAMHGEDFIEFIRKPEEGTFPGDGTFANVTQRIKVGLKEIVDGKDDKNIVIVSHGGIVRLIVSYLLEFENGWYNKTWIDNTSISVVEIKDRGNLLRILNDCSHIDTGIV